MLACAGLLATTLASPAWAQPAQGAGPITAAAASAAASSATATATATAAAAAIWLPPTEQVLQALARQPAYLASQREGDAALTHQQQLRVGPEEWTVSASAARRNQPGALPARSGEWELGLERPWRLPGKTAGYEQLGQARLQRARALQSQAWREQGRALLQGLGDWWREHETLQLWAQQLALHQRSLSGIGRQQALGTAARLELQQAEAALLVVQARYEAALAQRELLGSALRQRYGALLPETQTRLPAPNAPTAPTAPAALPQDAATLAARLRQARPELQLALAEHQTAQAQAQVESAARRADPSIGLRLGQASSGGERFVGLVFSLPLGGRYREAGAQAAAQQAQAAAWALQAAEREAELAAEQWQRQAETAFAQWQWLSRAAAQLGESADGLNRAYALGEGTLAEVLAARRLAAEQAQAARLAGVEAWMSQLRLKLEAGLLWPETR